MLIKFFGGSGSGGGISNYLVDPDRPGREKASPEILSGDIERTRELIDGIDRKWTFTTGVISFAPEDQPTESQQKRLMADFEKLAFAGLAQDRYDITWVRHTHTSGGRVELHFLVPRLDLATGKSFNIAPPGWERSYAPLRDAYNFEFGWARPDDPARARTQQIVRETVPRFDSREAISAYLEQKIVSGDVGDRRSLIAALNEAGLETPRQGKAYVTALDPESGERWRLKGWIFEKDWTRDAEIERATEGEHSSAAKGTDRADAGRAAEARQRLEAVIERRAEWVRERYPDAVENDPGQRERENGSDQKRSGRDQGKAEALDHDQRSDGHRNRDDILGRTDDLAKGSVASSETRHDSPRDLSDPADRSGAGMAVWRAILHKIGGLNDGEVDVDRESAVAGIRALGSRIRDIGASAFSTFHSLFSRNQSAERETDQFRSTTEALSRCHRTAERANDQLEQADHAVSTALMIRQQIIEFNRDLERAER